jgi:hypothetical protein
MKFSNSDYHTLLSAFTDLFKSYDKQLLITKYETGQFIRSELVKDLNKRFMWDLFWYVDGHKIIDLSNYNDSHTETAIKRALKELEIKPLVKKY